MFSAQTRIKQDISSLRFDFYNLNEIFLILVHKQEHLLLIQEHLDVI